VSGIRVIGGKARGRRLKAVPGDTTRPVTDRVKESVFNIIGPDIENASLLDLFAGTGSIGIEALSRGASYVRFLDLNRKAVATIQSNLVATGLNKDAQVQRLDAFVLIGGSPDRTFDYVYIAPPQYKGLWKRALLALDSNPGWLAEDGWVVVQIHPAEYEPLELKNLEEFDQRRYGSTLVAFYQPVLPNDGG
jgi:16S rRNA (guanine966-N2)-methyltransferase